MSTVRPSWPQVVFVVAFLRVLAQRRDLLNDPDTYLHVAAGRWILAHHALPYLDPFSHSMAGAPWVPHEWLAELILAAGFDVSGWAGLMLLTTLCFALAMALLTRRLLDHFEPFSALILVISSIALLMPHLVVRAHVLALPLLVLWSAEVIRARDAGRPPSFWLLPVMTLWANLHGSSMAGLALVLFLTAETALEDRVAARRWGLFLLLSIGAALLTPNGLDGFLVPFRLSGMGTLQAAFIEWHSPDFATFQPIELWLGAAILGLCLGLRLRPTRVVVLLALFYFALRHQRHGDLLAVIGPLSIAASLGPQLAARIQTDRPSALSRRVASLAAPASPAATAAVALIVAAIGASSLGTVERTDDPVTPATALAAARKLELTGPVFNDEGFGGYLVFNGVPTFIDGRIELFGDAFLKRYMAAEGGDEAALTGILDQYQIGWTLLAPGSRAVAVLDRTAGWHRVHADEIAVIHARDGGGR